MLDENKTKPKTYYGKKCGLCGRPVTGKVVGYKGDNCEYCKNQKKGCKDLCRTDYLGTQICPVDGFEKEIALCLEQKSIAIDRKRKGIHRTPLEKSCLLCGASPNFIGVRCAERPEIERKKNKAGQLKKGPKSKKKKGKA